MNVKHINMNQGFTLVELLVVISIILILSAMIFPNYQRGESEMALWRSASKLAQDLRRAQEMAMSTKEYSLGEVPKGYGIYLKTGDKSYLLYADKDGNEKYDSGEEVGDLICFEEKVYIKGISLSPLSVNFKSPDPKTKILSETTEIDSATITLSLEGSESSEKYVRVNKAGLIYVE